MGKKRSSKLFAILFIAAFAFACVFATACSSLFGTGSSSGETGSVNSGDGNTDSDGSEESDVYIYLEPETITVNGTGTARAYVKVIEEIEPEEENPEEDGEGIRLYDETEEPNPEVETGENDDPEDYTQGNDDSEDTDLADGDNFEEDDNSEEDEPEIKEPEKTVVTKWELYTGSCSWGTSDSSVIDVLSNGDGTATVKGTSEGTAKILLTLKDGSGRTGETEITVEADPNKVPDPVVKDVTIVLSETSVEVGREITAEAVVKMDQEGAEYGGGYSWFAADESVLTVVGNEDNTATIAGITDGETTITVMLDNGETAETEIKVEARTPQILYVEITSDKNTVLAGDEITLAVVVTMDTEGAQYEGSYAWTVYGDDVLEITEDDGDTVTMTALAEGVSRITVTLDDGSVWSLEITVTVPKVENADITLMSGEVALESDTIKIYDEISATAEIYMDTEGKTYEGTVTWSSGNGAVLEVTTVTDGSATIKAVGAGTADLVLTLDDGSEWRKAITVEPAEIKEVTIVFTPESADVYGNITVTITVEMDVEGAVYDGDFILAPMNGSIAEVVKIEVSDDGTATATIRGIAEGTTSLMLILDDGVQRFTQNVTFTAPEGGYPVIAFFDEADFLVEADGSNFTEPTLYIVMSEESGEYKGNYTWTSSNENVATVDENGAVTLHDTGVAEITVKLDYGITASYTISKKAIITGTDPVIGDWEDYVTFWVLVEGVEVTAKVDISIQGGSESGNKELFTLKISEVSGNGLDDLLAAFGMDLASMNMTLFNNQPWYKVGDTYYITPEDNAGTSYLIPVTIEEIDGKSYLCINFTATMAFDMGSMGMFDLPIGIVNQYVGREPRHIHSYGEADWKWTPNSQGGYDVTVTWTCTADDCDETDGYTFTAEATVYSYVSKEPDCENEGETTYTASVTIYGTEYTNTIYVPIEALGHNLPDLSDENNLSKLVWDWDNAEITSENGGIVKVTLTCGICGKVIEYEATFTITVNSEPTCTAEGLETYHGTVCIDDKYNNGTFTSSHEIILDKFPHTYPVKGNDGYGTLVVWDWDGRDHGQQLVHLIVYCSECGTTVIIDEYVKYEEADNGDGTKTLTAEYSVEDDGRYTYSSSAEVEIGKAEVGSVKDFVDALEEYPDGDLQITLTGDIKDEDGSLLAALNEALSAEDAKDARKITIYLEGHTLTLTGDASLAIGASNALIIVGNSDDTSTRGTLKLDQTLDVTAGSITVAEGSTITIENTKVETKASAIIAQGGASSVTITESSISAGGTYGIAVTGTGSGIAVTVENSAILANSQGDVSSTAVLIDASSQVTITGSTLEGNSYGIVVKAGNVAVKNTKICVTVATDTQTGEDVLAAVLICDESGENSTVTVVLDGAEISTGSDEGVFAAYLYSSENGCGISLTVTNTAGAANAFELVPSGIGETQIDGVGSVYIGVNEGGFVVLNEVKFVHSAEGTSVEVGTEKGLANALAMSGTFVITITADLSDSAKGEITNAFNVALNEENNYDVTINLGTYTLDLSAYTAGGITVGAGSKLTICGEEGSELVLPAYVSGLIVKGTLTVSGTTVTAQYGAIENIGGTLSIADSSVIGGYQGLVVRGGNAIITNTTITATGTNALSEYADEDGTPRKVWDGGVPNAAVVLGNYGEGNTYIGDTDITFTDVTLAVEYADGNGGAVYFGLYVYSQNEDCAVKITIDGNCNFVSEWLGCYTMEAGFKVYCGAGEGGSITVDGNKLTEPYMVGVELDASEYKLDVEDEFVLTAIIIMSDGTTCQDTALTYVWSYDGDVGNITTSESKNNVVIKANAAGLVTITVIVEGYSASCDVTLYLDPLIGTWVATDVDVTLSALGITASVIVDAGIKVTKKGFDLWIVPTYIDSTLSTLLDLAKSFIGEFNLSIGESFTLFSNQGWRVNDDVENGYIIDADFEGDPVTIYATIDEDGRLNVPFDGALMGFIGLVFDATADKYDGTEATVKGVALSTTSYNVDLKEGESGEYTITAVKTDGTSVTSGFEATSSDNTIAAVSVDGATLTVTAVGGGTAVITVTAGEASRTLVVVVPVSEPTVESVTFGNGAVVKAEAAAGTFDSTPKYTVTLIEGETVAQEDYIGSVAWMSSDTTVATVNGEGNVTLTGKSGIVFITVYIENCSAYYTLVVGSEDITENDSIMGIWTGTMTFEVSVTTLLIFTTDYAITAEIEITADENGFTFIVTFVEATSSSGSTVLSDVIEVWSGADIYKIDGIYYVVNSAGTGLETITINDEGKLCMSFSLDVSLSEISYTGEVKFEISFNNANAIIVADATFGYGCIYATEATSGVISEGLPAFTVTMSDGSVVSQAEYDGKISWMSSDTSVATVDSYGNITLTGSGVATITVFVGDCSASYMIVVGYTEISDYSELAGTWSSEDVSFEASVKGSILTTKYTVTGTAELEIASDGTITMKLNLTKARPTIGSTTLTDEIVVLEQAKIFVDGNGLYYMIDPVTGNVFSFKTEGNEMVVEIMTTIEIPEISFEGEVDFSVTFTS